ncbi:cytochrome P450 [Amycolatopsis sp. NPDC026612]|uniref:cytochrome P450 n=1 Tax=Amycolatopsis sp. NPDC026612 TaxID=3155466 RepID=UPI0033E86B8B
MVAVADTWGAPQSLFWLRGERPAEPVTFDPATKVWNVYGHADALRILNDPATFSSAVQRKIPIDDRVNEGNLLRMDGVPHAKLRKIVSRVFTPKVVAGLEPRIAELTRDLLDGVGGRDRFELIEQLAYPLPVIVIAELLGVPAEDHPLFKQWVDMMFRGREEIFIEAEGDEKVVMDGAEEVLRYIAGHVAERRSKPHDDLLSKLVEAEVDGERLSDAEVVNFGFVLLLTGHITTTMLLGNAVLCLDAHPEWRERARADRTIVPAVIEESLRLLPPFAAVSRLTNEAVELSGQHIPADELLMVWLAAANRDETAFPAPDTFDPARDPNNHLSFGRGVHFCMGAPLARLEGRIALNILLDRFPHLRTDPLDGPVFKTIPIMTGIDKLPLLTGAAG